MMRAFYQMAQALGGNSGSALAEIVDPVEPGSLVISLNLKTKVDGSIGLADPKQPFELAEATKDKKVAYALKKGASKRAPYYTPMAQVTFDPKKDTPNKIRTFDIKLRDFFRMYSGNDKSILAVKDFFTNEKVVADLRRTLYDYLMQLRDGPKEVKGKKSAKIRRDEFLTLKIDGKLPGERPEYQALLYEAVTGSLGEGRSEGIGQCCITLEHNVPVYGRASLHFPFYTIDKPGMIVGGFREENAWKNFPVSSIGGQALKQVREYLNEHQSFCMPGKYKVGGTTFRYTYWIIPKFVFSYDQGVMREMLNSLAILSKRSPGFGLGEEAAKEYSTMEEDLKLLSNDRLLLTFLFYQQNKGQLLIKLAVDDVPPSRLRNLIKTQERIAKLHTYSRWIKEAFEPPKTEDSVLGLPIRFSFGLIWSFYERSAQKASDEQRYNHDYLQFIRQLYLAMPPDPRRILRVIMETLEALFKNPDLRLSIFDYHALQGLCWVRYLCELNLWQSNTSMKGVEMNLETLSIEPNFKKRNENGEFADPWMASLEKFLEEHPELMRSQFLCGAFFLGVLVRQLMFEQAKGLTGNRYARAPFEKELKGLRLKREDIPLLFSKTVAKLHDYESDNYSKIRVLDQLVSDLCLRERVENLKLSSEEISAYFSFGLAQGRVFDALTGPKKTNSKNSNDTE